MCFGGALMMSFGGFAEGSLVAIAAVGAVPVLLAPASGGMYGAFMCGSGGAGGGVAAPASVTAAPLSSIMYGELM